MPSAAVERSASASPSGSPLASTVIAYGPTRLGVSASVCAPSFAAVSRREASASTYSTDPDPSATASPAAYRPIEPGPAPPTTNTSAPGHSASDGPTARQASLMLSDALATAAGSRPAGTGTSMCSAYGTHTTSDRKPPQRSTAGPKP